MIISAILAVVGLIVGFGTNSVITKQKQGSAQDKADKELAKAKKEADRLIDKARE